MAIIKHIAIKNSNYDAAVDYLTLKHDEFTNKAILDENGNPIPREEYLIEGLNCNPFTFGRECESTNAYFHQNQSKAEIKAHHYIISFDPRDRDENDLTLESAEAMAVEFARKNFPGHQAIICAHPDGHNSAGNIHVHIVFNSVRKLNVELQDFMERPGDALAGHKHHVTKDFLSYLKQETMTMCQENSLYQVDLLSPAKIRITDREYWAQRKGQAALDKENAKEIAAGTKAENLKQTKYQTDKDLLRDAIKAVLSDSRSYEDFCKRLFETYGISVHENRGRISYILPDKERPIRDRQLGTDFEKEHIENVLKEYTAGHPSGKYISTVRLITDLESCIKAQQSQVYARKVKVGNLQKMADTLAFLKDNNIESIEALDQLLSATAEDVSQKHKALKATETELTKTNLLIKYTGQYLTNKTMYHQYLSSKNKKVFREEHRAELSLYEAARKYLQENTQTKSNPNQVHVDLQKSKFPVSFLEQLKVQKEKLTAIKNQHYEEYTCARAKHRELQNVRSNLQEITNSEIYKQNKREQSL